MSKRVAVTVIVGIVVAIVLLFVAEVASEDDAATFVEHMHGHLDEVSAVKSAVIAGDLGATRPAARNSNRRKAS